MEPIEDKLEYLIETKQLIKDAIKLKGQEVSDNLPFRKYAEKIESITTGGDATSDATLIAKYLLEGYSAVVDGQWVAGKMKNYGTKTYTYSNVEQNIPTGYYDSLTINKVAASALDGYTQNRQAILDI